MNLGLGEKTVSYALGMLNVHREFCDEKGKGQKEQIAYYKGLRDMLEAIVTAGHTNGKVLTYDGEKHEIWD